MHQRPITRKSAWGTPIASTRTLPTLDAKTSPAGKLTSAAIPSNSQTKTPSGRRPSSSQAIRRAPSRPMIPTQAVNLSGPPLIAINAWGDTPVTPAKNRQTPTQITTRPITRPATASAIRNRSPIKPAHRHQPSIVFPNAPKHINDYGKAMAKNDRKEVERLEEKNPGIQLTLEQMKLIEHKVSDPILAPKVTRIKVKTPQLKRIKITKAQFIILNELLPINPSPSWVENIKLFFTRNATDIDINFIASEPIKNIICLNIQLAENLNFLMKYERSILKEIPQEEIAAACIYVIRVSTEEKVAANAKAILHFLHARNLLDILEVNCRGFNLRATMLAKKPKQQHLEIAAYLSVLDRKSEETQIDAFISAIPNFTRGNAYASAIDLINFLALHNILPIINKHIGGKIIQELRKLFGIGTILSTYIDQHLKLMQQKAKEKMTPPRARDQSKPIAIDQKEIDIKAVEATPSRANAAIVSLRSSASYRQFKRPESKSSAQRSAQPTVAKYIPPQLKSPERVMVNGCFPKAVEVDTTAAAAGIYRSSPYRIS